MCLATGMASRLGVRGGLAIFIFHRVHAARDPLFPGEATAAWFDGLLERLGTWYRVMPLDEAVGMLTQGRLPPRAAAITFDDGYADNHSIAMPILLRHRLCATFFIASGFLDGGRMWNDTVIEAIRRVDMDRLPLDPALGELSVSTRGTGAKQAAVAAVIGRLKYLPESERFRIAEHLGADVALPSDLMMRSEDVLDMHRRGMRIGAHTLTHPILARASDDEAERQIAEGRARLEAITGSKVTLFAYPNGRPGTDFGTRDVELVQRLGFAAAVSTRPAIATPTDAVHELPRFTPWDRSYARFGLRMLWMYGRRALQR